MQFIVGLNYEKVEFLIFINRKICKGEPDKIGHPLLSLFYF